MNTKTTTPKRKGRRGRPRNTFSKQFEEICNNLPESILKDIEKWNDELERDMKENPISPEEAALMEVPSEYITTLYLSGGVPKNHPEANKAVRVINTPKYTEYEVLDYYINQ